MTFVGLDERLCYKALSIIKPAVDAAMEARITNRGAGNLVVLDPKIPREPKYKNWSLDPEDPFEELVLFETQWGERSLWEHPYDSVSRAKAFASWKTGLPTHAIQALYPYLYEEGWTKHAGSAVGAGGLVVAFSGVQGYYDRMIAEMMLAAITGVCMHEMHDKEAGVMANQNIDFLGVV